MAALAACTANTAPISTSASTSTSAAPATHRTYSLTAVLPTSSQSSAASSSSSIALQQASPGTPAVGYIGTPEVGQIGQPLPVSWKSKTGTDGSGTVTILSARRWSPASGGTAAPAKNGSYLRLQLAIKVNSGSANLDPAKDFSAHDASGTVTMPAELDGMNSMNGGSLTANEEGRGMVLFDVPAGETTIFMTYQTVYNLAKWQFSL